MTRRPLLLLAAGVLALSAVIAPATAQETGADPLAPLRRALANREWKTAEQLATRAISAKSADEVDLLLLRAVARRHGGNKPGALADLRAVQGHAAAGRRASKAAFRTAALLADMGRAEEALQLTQTAVAALRAGERRDAIAAIYLDVVDSLVRPKPAEGVTVAAPPADPDWKGAYLLLKKAEELELAGATAARIQLDLLRAEIETSPRGSDPVARAKKFLDAHPTHAELAEVRFLLGRGLVRARRAMEARDAFLAVVQHHGESAWAPKALDASAAALLEHAADPEALAAAIADTEQLISSHGEHALAPPALFRLAEAFAKQPPLLERALAAFDRCATRWPQHASAGTARLRQAALLAQDGRGPAAIALLQAFLKGRAVDAAWQAAVQQIADTRHALAGLHYQAGMEKLAEDLPGLAARRAEQQQHRAAARGYWQALMDETPTDPRVPFALYALAEMQLRDGQAAEAIAAWERLATRFPGTGESARARYAVATTYADTLKEYARALAAFKKVPDGDWGKLAKRQIAALQAEALALRAARVFRSGEALTVELETRNITKLELAAYRVDLKEHFLQTGHLDGLVQLDVALIKADHTWTVTIDDPKPLAPRTQTVALASHLPAVPAGGAAAWVITARANVLEARTAVIVSDLEALTALAQARTWSHVVDRRSGARVDGSGVHRALDGALLPPGPSLPEDPADGTMSVLVERQGHAALADLDARKLQQAAERKAAGWVWTDRYAYERGDTIHVFGLVRDVEGGRIVVPPSGAYRCVLFDTTTRIELAREVVRLNAEGAFAFRIALPPTLLGERRCELRLEKDAGATDVQLVRAHLQVGGLERPVALIDLDAPSAPVKAGSAVEARIRVTDGHREPIAHERIRVLVTGGKYADYTTDALGYCTVAVPAEATALESCYLTVVARGLRQWLRVPVEPRDVRVTVTGLLADGVPGVAGEAYPVTLELRRGEQPAAGVELRASVWRPDAVTGWSRIGEPQTLQSGADGNVTWTVQPAAGGTHRLRVEYTGRWGLPVRLEWPLPVAGAGDPARVRIVAAKLAQPAGATVQLRLATDLPAASAWVMVHGDRLWSATRIALTGGLTPFEVTLPPAPHRNARVTCVVEHDGRLYQPEVRFRIDHALTVKCEVPEGPQRPGATARVRVALAGPTGAPVTGHVTLLVQHDSDGRGAQGRVGDLAQRFVPDDGRSYLRFGLSAAYRPPATVEARDAAIDQALAELTAAANRAHGPVMVEQVPLDDIVRQRALPGALNDKYWNDSIGVGGGAGGQFGGRLGGKRDLVARGGGGRGGRGIWRVPRPPVLVRGALRTAADGTVTVDVPLPLVRGTYRVTVVAASGTTLFGKATAALEVGGDLAVELSAPSQLRRSDRSAIRVRLFNRGSAPRRMTVTATREGGAAGSPAEVELAPGTAREIPVPLPALTTGANDLRIAVDPGDGSAPVTASRRILVIADAPTTLVGAAGMAVAAVDAEVAAGASGPLRIYADASPQAALMTVAEQPDARATDRITAAAELWTAAEALLAAPAEARDRAAGLRAIAERRLYRLLGLRAKSARGRRDSSWRNCAEAGNGSPDPEAVALTLVAFARAKAAGLPVPASRLTSARSAVDGHFTDATDDAAKAWLLFCRSFDDAPAYAWVNRLYRARGSLGTRSLALLAHTLATGGRTAEAKQVLSELEGKATGAAGSRHWTATAPAGRIGEEPVTVTAIVVEAARVAGHESAVVAEARRWFAAARRGAGWPAPFAAVVALRKQDAGAPAASVAVQAGGRAVGTITLGSVWASGRLTVPASELGDGAAAVRLTPAGGAVWWSASRTGSAPAADDAPAQLAVQRERTRVAGRVDGDRLEAGRKVELGFHSHADQSPAPQMVPGWATRVDVTVTWGAAAPGVYWLFEPLPSGAELVADSVEDAEMVVRTADGLWAKLPRDTEKQLTGGFSYRLRGVWPGTYVTGAARVARSPYGAAWSLGVPGHAEAVVAPAASDPNAGSVLSTDERRAAGTAALARKDYAAARDYLLPLADRRLRFREFQAVTRDLLAACVGAKAGEDVVRFFEVLRERDPQFVISFDRMVDVGASYAAMGEHERSRQIYAAVADALFLQEAGAVGALEQLGHTREAFGAAERLLAEYGDSDVVRSTMFAYAQRAFFVGRKAPATRAAAGDGYTRDDLFAVAAGALHRYLADYATDASADEVSLTLATAQMEAGDFTAARATAADSAARHADSRFLDTFDYIQAAAAFALRDFDAALALCRRLITHDYGAQSNPGPAVTAALGHHMTAQIHHARGELEQAVESYRKVRDRFADAARALRFLQREGLRVPELTVVRGAEPVRLEVEHRGTDALVVQVYPVDLRMLLMTHRDTAGLAAVNLAGVKPAVLRTVPAGAPGPRGVQPVELALPKVGAYLVVVRAGALRARGLVVRSDLALEVQPAGGNAYRVNVVSVGTGAYVARSAVTFIGGESRIVSRQTDLRGICEAGGLPGLVNIVAEHDGHYAVHFGSAAPQTGGDRNETENDEEFEQAQSEEPMDQLQERLKDIRGKNEQAWKSNTTKQQKGVEAGRAKK